MLSLHAIHIYQVLFISNFQAWHAPLNRQAIIHVLDDVIKAMKIDRENFVLLLSDAARYMTAAGSLLMQLYPRLSHVTCIAHLLHNCAEKVWNSFGAVDTLIATVKAATVRNKDRKELFSEIGYPPDPVITRWGTWLKAAFYYADKLPKVKEVIESFDGHGLLVTRVKAAAAAPSLSSDLLAIRRDYTDLVRLLEKCESSSYTIAAAHCDLQQLMLGSDSCKIRLYLDKRLSNNPSLLDIMSLKRDDISPTLYGCLQQCQPTSVCVERSFSILKKMLAKDRNFKPENIESYCMMLFNAERHNTD